MDLYRWLARWASGGMDALLATDVPAGRPVWLAPEILAGLEPARHRPAGVASDEALRPWVRRTHGVAVQDQTRYTLVRTRFQTKRKGARPRPTQKS